jgi:hypothetical protein
MKRKGLADEVQIAFVWSVPRDHGIAERSGSCKLTAIQQNIAYWVNPKVQQSSYQRRMIDKATKANGYRWFKAILSTLILVALSLGTGESNAGNIGILSNSQVTVVVVGGELLPGDGELFRRKTNSLSYAVVAFWSSGGNLMAGIEIGETIRAKGFDTLVLYRCASACALAWLGGAERAMAPDALIGFHAAKLRV